MLINDLPKIHYFIFLPLWYLSSPPQSVYPGGVVVVELWGSWHPPSSLLPGGKNYWCWLVTLSRILDLTRTIHLHVRICVWYLCTYQHLATCWQVNVITMKLTHVVQLCPTSSSKSTNLINKNTENHNFAIPPLNCVTMATCDKIWKHVGSNLGPYTE